MSRTIRRKGKKPNNNSRTRHFERDWTHEYEVDEVNLAHPFYRCWATCTEIRKGKEFNKAWWEYHRDRRNSYGFNYHTYWRFEAERNCRNLNKQELVKWIKNPDYEVLLHEPKCLSWYF